MAADAAASAARTLLSGTFAAWGSASQGMFCANESRESICETSSWACFWRSAGVIESKDRAEHGEHDHQSAHVREHAEAGSAQAVSG